MILSEFSFKGITLFMAYLANLFVTKLQGPILPRKSRDHIKSDFPRSFRFFPISIMLKMPIWNGHIYEAQVSGRCHMYQSTQNDQSYVLYT